MNGPLHTEIRGDPASGRTVVFLPGLGGTTRYWASRIAALEDRYRIVLVDLLGFGDSPRPWTRYSVARHVEALGDALQPYGRVTLVGHSLGALLAIAYAARYPDRVGGLALLGMPCFAGQRDAYAHYRHGPMRAGFLATNVALAAATCILTRRLLGRLLPYLIRHVPARWPRIWPSTTGGLPPLRCGKSFIGTMPSPTSKYYLDASTSCSSMAAGAFEQHQTESG